MPLVSIKCELCGSNDIIRREDGMFECGYCGTKYTLEAARSLMQGEAVQVRAADFVIRAGTLEKYNGESAIVVIPSNVASIDKGAFEHSSITEVSFPKGLMTIGSGAFHGCDKLAQVILPEGLEEIGPSAFEGCSSLTKVVLPDSLRIIGERAFAGCAKIKSVELPKGLREVDVRAFEDMEGLTAVEVPDDAPRFFTGDIHNRTYLGADHALSFRTDAFKFNFGAREVELKGCSYSGSTNSGLGGYGYSIAFQVDGVGEFDMRTVVKSQGDCWWRDCLCPNLADLLASQIGEYQRAEKEREERNRLEREAKAREELIEYRCYVGRCQHCGGVFRPHKKLFGKTEYICEDCHRAKDY